MDVQIAVKNITYGFPQSAELGIVTNVAENSAKELYLDEQEFQMDEYQEMLEDGDVSSFAEYREAVGISSFEVDYSKSFEENIHHPDIQKQISELTNKYMCNVHDLPRDAVVTIDDSFLDAKGRPDESAVRSALREKFGEGVQISNFEHAGVAEKKDILKQNAYEKVGDMIASKDFQTFLDLRASIEKYSSNNIAMIYLQKPDAKAVMGFHAWKALDRHVDAGQNAIAIWQPLKKELRTEAQVDREIANNSWLYGEPDSQRAIKAKAEMMEDIEKTGKTEVFSGYKLGNVFDVAQTVSNDPEHDNLMQIINLEKPLNQDMANYEAVADSMRKAAGLAPFSIPKDMSQQDALFSAVVAYADHVFSHQPDAIDGIKSPTPQKGDMHDIEVMMSAYLVCKHIGIDCEDKVGLKLAEIFNKDNLSEQAITVGKREMFTKSFDRACKLSDQFDKAFDKDFGYSIEAQREALKQQIADEKAAKEAEFKEKAATRVWFGRTPAQRVDEWQKDGVTYTIGQIEATGKYCVKMLDENKKGSYLRDDDGKPVKFNTQPSREDIEDWASMDKTSPAKTEPDKKKTDKDAISME